MSMSEAEAIIHDVRAYSDVELISSGKGELAAPLVGELLSVPAGRQVLDLRPHLDLRLNAPRRTKGTARHTDLLSFVAHVKRFARPESAVFAVDTPSAPKLIAVYDYHAAGAPAFQEHRAEYQFPLAEEWTAWAALFASKGLSQAEFAAHLEDRVVDVIDPSSVGAKTRKVVETLGLSLASPAAVLGLSRGISIRAETRVTNVTNLSTGEAQIVFEEKHSDEAGGRVKVPGGFVIGVPVFRGGVPYQIAVRIRYRVRDGVVTWTFSPHRIDAVFRDAFEEACALVQTETALPLFVGQPEQ